VRAGHFSEGIFGTNFRRGISLKLSRFLWGRSRTENAQRMKPQSTGKPE